jgi:hypothetical protein
LEVVVAFVNFFLAFLVVRMPWVWSVLKCSPKLLALFGSVVALQVPQALLFQQVFEAARGLLRVVFRRALDSRDCVVWLALAIRTRVVVVATALIPAVVVNTKNWYSKGTDLWAEFGNEMPFGRKNLFRGFSKDACGRQYAIIRQKDYLRF